MNTDFPLLIHIGYHKTGTTWLQKELFISTNEVFEPLSINDKGRSSLSLFFIKDKDNYPLSFFQSNSNIIKQELLKVLKEKQEISKDKCFVMSAERLSGIPHVGGGFDGEIIANRLHNIFPEAKILIGIREQKSFLRSIYFQYLSTGGVLNYKNYFDRNYDTVPSFTHNHIEYNLLVKKYQALFGKENVLVLPYELFKSKPLEYIKKLENLIERKIHIKKEKFNTYHNNKKYHFVLYYFRFFNFFKNKNSINNFSVLSNKYTGYIVLKMQNFLGFCFPENWNKKIQDKIKKHIDEKYSERYTESNKKLSELIGIDLKKYGYYKNE